MGMDLTIRLLGRPKVSKDTTQGFQTMARKYVVAGNRASERSLKEVGNPLFLKVGTPDVEFTDHRLVDQRLEPSDSMDRAYLSRTYLQMRKRWVQESVTENADMIKVTRTFVAIRSEVSIYGYSASAWAKHPSNEGFGVAKDNSEDPWDYAPDPVLNGSPDKVIYDDSEVSNSGFSEEPWVSIGNSSSSLADYLSSNASSVSLGVWVRGSAQVTMASPGVDVWNVSWVTHASPYWTFGTSGKGGSKGASFTLVDFDHLGLKLTNVGSAGGGGSVPLQAKTYNTFHVEKLYPTIWHRLRAAHPWRQLVPVGQFGFPYPDLARTNDLVQTILAKCRMDDQYDREPLVPYSRGPSGRRRGKRPLHFKIRKFSFYLGRPKIHGHRRIGTASLPRIRGRTYWRANHMVGYSEEFEWCRSDGS